MTEAAQKFITPLSVGALAGEHPFTDLFDATSEFDVGHIRLARDADLVVVAPATADLMAKMADGLADDLASAVLLATDKKILLAPAMNPHMWTQQGDAAQPRAARGRRRRARRPERRRDGRERRGRRRPHGRAAGDRRRRRGAARAAHRGALAGMRVLVTSGPTHEPIDPVRYIANRSSGKQGHAIAEAAAARRRRGDAGVRAGRTCPIRRGVNVVKVETRARDAGRGRGGAAGRCRGVRRRGRRLAHRREQPREDQEDRQGRARARAGREPRHPRRPSRIARRGGRRW